MKILHVTPFFYPSVAGMEVFVQKLSEGLSKKNDVRVLTINTENAKKEEVINGVKIKRCKQNIRFHKGLFSFEFIKELSKAECDVVHVHIPFPLGLELSLLTAKRKNIPVVITHHGEPAGKGLLYKMMNSFYSLVYKAVSLGMANLVVFSTGDYANSLNLKNSVKDKIKVIPCGVDAEKFRPKRVKKKWNKVVLFVGSLSIENRYKGLDVLLKAFKKIESKDIGLIVVGGGELIDEYKSLSKKIGLENFSFEGRVSDKKLIESYQSADVFVLSSKHGPESFGMVLAEAMACGVPCVTTDIPGPREVVGGAGIVVPRNDIKSLAEAIEKILSDGKLASSLGKKGRKKVVEKFSWKRIVGNYNDLYSSLL